MYNVQVCSKYIYWCNNQWGEKIFFTKMVEVSWWHIADTSGGRGWNQDVSLLQYYSLCYVYFIILGGRGNQLQRWEIPGLPNPLKLMNNSLLINIIISSRFPPHVHPCGSCYLCGVDGDVSVERSEQTAEVDVAGAPPILVHVAKRQHGHELCSDSSLLFGLSYGCLPQVLTCILYIQHGVEG